MPKFIARVVLEVEIDVPLETTKEEINKLISGGELELYCGKDTSFSREEIIDVDIRRK